jgi:hypothetical protein
MRVMYDPASGGLKPYAPDNFSKIEIDTGRVVVIPSGQEMLHVRDLMVRGDLIVRGDTYQIPETDTGGMGWTTIPAGTAVQVPQNRLMLYVTPLNVRGDLMVRGLLKEVA